MNASAWIPSVPIGELILRGVLVYAALLVLLRITGKRQIGQLAPFELVLLLVLSNAVQNAMNGGDNSITSGIVLAITLVSLNSLVSWLTYRSKWLEAVIEGRPEVLVHNGEIRPEGLVRARITHHELNAALRQSGYAGVHEVHSAVLENNGTISVTGKHNHDTAPGGGCSG